MSQSTRKKMEAFTVKKVSLASTIIRGRSSHNMKKMNLKSIKRADRTEEQATKVNIKKMVPFPNILNKNKRDKCGISTSRPFMTISFRVTPSWSTLRKKCSIPRKYFE